jgi:hypothetical protein
MKKLIFNILKILLLTIIYALTVTLISGTMISIGFDFPEMEIDEGSSFMQLLFVGFLSSLFIIYLSLRYIQLSKLHFFSIVFSILFLSNISVAIEGTLFTPELITKSVFLTLCIQQLVICLLYSFISLLMIKRKDSIDQESFIHRERITNISKLIPKLVLGGFIYMIMYYSWGWLNYNLFTKPFYDSGVGGLDIPSTFKLIESILFRGILITLSIVPFLLFAQPNSRNKMYEVGTILFVFGGLLPLSFFVSVFPMDFIAYSLVEILLQNFLTGMIIYRIYSTDKLILTV